MTDSTAGFSDATLARYLSGECDPAEAEAIRRWIETDPERQERVEALRAAWIEAEAPVGEWDADAMWEQMAARMDQPVERVPLQVIPGDAATRAQLTVRRSWFMRRSVSWGAVAAGIGVIIGGAWLVRAGPSSSAESVPMREVATTKGQRAELRLGDGSRVVLGVDSRIRFPAVAGPGARDVTLEGEAYFQVTHDPKRPFLVHAGGTVTEDLGTAFVIKSYRGDSAVRVVVEEGKVAVRRQSAARDRAIELVPGDLATVGPTGAPVVARGVDLDAYLAWTTGRLRFRRTPLADVIRELERWYAITITLANPSLDTIPLTGSFQDQSATDVLDAIARSLDLRYERQGDAVRFLPKTRR